MGGIVIPRGWRTSIMKNPLKGLRSVHKVLQNFPNNDSLVSFVLEIYKNQFFPLHVITLLLGKAYKPPLPYLAHQGIYRIHINSST